jgi:hypothetical protein
MGALPSSDFYSITEGWGGGKFVFKSFYRNDLISDRGDLENLMHSLQSIPMRRDWWGFSPA